MLNHRLKLNRYDWLIIILIAANAGGGLFAPLTLVRLFTILAMPFVLIRHREISCQMPRYAGNFFLIWLVFGFLSIIWTPDKLNGLKFLCYNISSCIAFSAIYIFSSKARNPIVSIIIGWSMLFLVTLPIALNELLNDVHLKTNIYDTMSVINESGELVSRRFASVTFGNLNNYVLTIVYCLPFVLYGMLKFKKYHILNWGIVGIMAFVLLLNASRGGVICLVLALVVFLYFSLKTDAVSRRRLYVMICIGVGLLIVYSNRIFGQLLGRVSEGALLEDNARSQIMINGLKVLAGSWGFGCGIGGIATSLQRVSDYPIVAMHNMLLEFLVEFGLVPFLFFLYMLCNIFKELIKGSDVGNRFLGFCILFIFLPMSIINSGYLEDQILWIFFASIMTIGRYGKFQLAKKDSI